MHFGSAVAALASWLDARAAGGTWLLRVEDIDPPREVDGASASILRDLAALGLTHDGPVLYQSQRLDAFEDAVGQLLAAGAAYRCICSRQTILSDPVNANRPTGAPPRYPGACRDRDVPAHVAHAVRLRVDDTPIEFDDRFQGPQRLDLARDCGDFVIRRRDGLIAYQLAVSVDDGYQQITDVVRGTDLLSSTPRQIRLKTCLHHPLPRYAHLPIVVGADQQKLSKQTGATALDLARPARVLHAALAFLRQQPPAALAGGHPGDVLDWAVHNWRPERFRGIGQSTVAAEGFLSLPCSTFDR